MVRQLFKWQGFLLHYGAHSERLHDSMAELARQLPNSIVDWSISVL